MKEGDSKRKPLIALNNLILHLHPKKVPATTLRFNLTFGLGGMTALLIVLQALTGILLRFIYVPTPEGAYDSVLKIQNELMLGNFIRNIHSWSASLLILLAFFHLLRVVFTGAFHDKRSTNWVFGMILLLLIVASNFTGYLLPWDQLAYWAVTVVSNMVKYVPLIGEGTARFMLQGNEVGGPTLIFFYNFHTSLLPLALIILMSFHFWRVRKAGGVVLPGGKSRREDTLVDVSPHLLYREFVVALVLLAFIFLIAVLFEAPLGERANPLLSPNPAKAPWYFLGFQELLVHFHPLIAILLIPLTAMVLLFWLPYLKYGDTVSGIWFLSTKGRRYGIVSIFLACILTPAFILTDEFVFRSSGSLAFIQNGWLTFLMFLGFLTGYIYLLRKKLDLDKAETTQTLFIYLVGTFILLTLTGILFRGDGMGLSWP